MKKFSRWGVRSFGVLLFGLAIAQFSHGTAFAAAKTWTGTAGDHKFSTAGNWSPSGAPVNGDSLVFPSAATTDTTPLTNDISNLSLTGMSFTGTTAGSYSFTGNNLAVSSSIAITVTADYFSASFLNPVTFSGATTIATPASTYISLYGDLSGSGNITKTGAGLIVLGGTNTTFSGSFAINQGSVQTNDPAVNPFGSASAGTTIADGASLQLCYYSDDITFDEPLTVGGTGIDNQGAISVAGCGGGGDVNKTATFAGPVTLTTNTTVNGYNKNKLKITGALSGNYTLKLVDGANASLEIASSNNTSATPNGSYTPNAKIVTIPAGDDQPNTALYIAANEIYIVNGVRGDVTMYGGILKGTGKVGDVSMAVGTVIAPGNSPGCLTTGNLELDGGTYQFEANGITACTNYDQLVVNGTVTLTGDNNTLSTTLLNGYVPKAGDVFTVINNDGTDAVTGTFKGLAEGATFELNGVVFKISYVGGTGNDVTLSVVSVPAVPNTGAALVTGNPLVLAGLGLASTATLLVASRKYVFKRK